MMPTPNFNPNFNDLGFEVVHNAPGSGQIPFYIHKKIAFLKDSSPKLDILEAIFTDVGNGEIQDFVASATKVPTPKSLLAKENTFYTFSGVPADPNLSEKEKTKQTNAERLHISKLDGLVWHQFSKYPQTKKYIELSEGKEGKQFQTHYNYKGVQSWVTNKGLKGWGAVVGCHFLTPSLRRSPFNPSLIVKI